MLRDNDPTMEPGSVGAEYPLRNSTKSVSNSDSLSPTMRTVYHCEDLTVEIANELWGAGFREIDTPDDYHMTPLMMIHPISSNSSGGILNDAINYAFWLCQKGALLHRPQRATLHPVNSKRGSNEPPIGPLAIHFVADAFSLTVEQEAVDHWIHDSGKRRRGARNLLESSFPARLEPLIDDLSLKCQHFLHSIMLDPSHDGCICACSKNGCLPVTDFLKNRYTSLLCSDEQQDRYILEWKLLWLFNNVPSEQLHKTVIDAIVRLLTFERLGLRHTCCQKSFEHFVFRTIDAEEAEEIRDEDRDGIELLGSLLLKFKENYDDRDLKTWLREYWYPEMEEILAARDREPIDEASLREAGVTLRKDHGISDQGWC